MMLFSTSENDDYFYSLKDLLSDAKNEDQLFQTIVNAPFTDKGRVTLLGLGIIMLVMVNRKTKTVDWRTRSETDFAKAAFKMSIKPFKEIQTPMDYKGNFIVDAIKTERYQQTSDWHYLYTPALTAQEARLNQAAAGIGCSYVYPLVGVRNGGALIFNYYLPLDKIEPEHHTFMRSYSRIVTDSIRLR